MFNGAPSERLRPTVAPKADAGAEADDVEANTWLLLSDVAVLFPTPAPRLLLLLLDECNREDDVDDDAATRKTTMT